MFEIPSNPNILAQCIALIGVVPVWLFVRTNIFLVKSITAVLAILCIGAIIVLGSRTAALALLAAVLFICYPLIKGKGRRIIFKSSGFLLLLIIAFLSAALVKQNSASGRLFIWRRSLELWKDNWLKGVGYGKFNPAYNHWQADYFSTRSLTSKEAILADDGYYAFNEWLHVAVEWGIAGLVIALSITIVVLRTCFKNINTEDSWAAAMLVTILVGCLFSYPLHNVFIIATTAFLTGYITRSSFKAKARIPLLIQWVFFIVLVTGLVLLSVKQEQQKDLLATARQSVKDGYKTEAYAICQQLKKELRNDYEFSLFYLQLLYETSRLTEAINWFNQFHNWHCNQKVHSIIAKCYEESGEYSLAEQHFLTSLYITPALLQSRMDLVEFYERRSDMSKAKYWAKQIVVCPVKIIDNPQAYILKEQATSFLDQHPE